MLLGMADWNNHKPYHIVKRKPMRNAGGPCWEEPYHKPYQESARPLGGVVGNHKLYIICQELIRNLIKEKLQEPYQEPYQNQNPSREPCWELC